MERRLAAILAADMVGYSYLMATGEAETLTRQKRLRQQLIDPKIVEYGGRIFKSTGDGVLVEFASIVDALCCAVSIQLAMPDWETSEPEDHRIAYRMGINLGDMSEEFVAAVYSEGDDVADSNRFASGLQEWLESRGAAEFRLDSRATGLLTRNGRAYGIATDDDTFQAARAFCDRLGKETSVSEDFPAFIVNRILIPMINEAVYVLYEGVGTVSGIDKARVGQVAANIRDFRKPDRYKGKGVRYEGEYISLKAGKSA